RNRAANPISPRFFSQSLSKGAATRAPASLRPVAPAYFDRVWPCALSAESRLRHMPHNTDFSTSSSELLQQVPAQPDTASADRGQGARSSAVADGRIRDRNPAAGTQQ